MANVWYIGQADDRRVFGQSFNLSNGWSLPESLFTQQQLVDLDYDVNFLLGQPNTSRVRPFIPDQQNGPDAYLAEMRRILSLVESGTINIYDGGVDE